MESFLSVKNFQFKYFHHVFEIRLHHYRSMALKFLLAVILNQYTKIIFQVLCNFIDPKDRCNTFLQKSLNFYQTTRSHVPEDTTFQYIQLPLSVVTIVLFMVQCKDEILSIVTE